MRYKVYIAFTLVLIISFSCRSTRPAVVPSSGGSAAGSYIERYSALAVSEMKRTGIPASITLAQGMIESDYGRSRLAREANNHFGIKCHDDWSGPSIRHHDDRRNECFRKYRRPEDSFYDHSEFLKTRSRYAFLFDLPATDYKGWARGLRKAGYATNPDYANMLIRKIEENRLQDFDKANIISQKVSVQRPVVANVPPPEPITDEGVVQATDPEAIAVVRSHVPRVMEKNRIKYIIVRDGETVGSIEEDFQLLGWELARYNELDPGFIPVPGQILYLQPKRNRAEPGQNIHTAAEGETLYLISQKYGVRLYKLREYNRMQEGEEPAAGQQIWLRAAKPVN